ncbi:hypothetical protein KCP77_20680 [Salmonella enterica subsp. enterica]|nr:hypothetical protein KCP77_20680 [Salmonella enterica subsp. enterica]
MKNRDPETRFSRSPDGMRVEVIRAGEYDDKRFPARRREIAPSGRVSRARNQRAVKRQKRKSHDQ